MLPSETMIWQPEFTDKTLSRKPGAVHYRWTKVYRDNFIYKREMLFYHITFICG
ncbi:hypothetical protein GOP13_23585 [Escherichia coli]|nr:hypothetical protein [Escherichia coli]